MQLGLQCTYQLIHITRETKSIVFQLQTTIILKVGISRRPCIYIDSTLLCFPKQASLHTVRNNFCRSPPCGNMQLVLQLIRQVCCRIRNEQGQKGQGNVTQIKYTAVYWKIWHQESNVLLKKARNMYHSLVPTGKEAPISS